jgi:hypothetical protein
MPRGDSTSRLLSRTSGRPISLDSTGFTTGWPIIDRAIRWLIRQHILSPRQTAVLTEQVTLDVDSDLDPWADDLEAKVNAAVVDSVREGDGRDEWKQRLSQIVDVKANEAETIGRTWAHRAQHEGYEYVVQSSPAVAELFPCATWRATRDTQTRPEHRALNEKVAYEGSPLFDEMQREIMAYGCRCSMWRIQESEAIRRGISEGGEKPGTSGALMFAAKLAQKPFFTRWRLGWSFVRKTGTKGWAATPDKVPAGASQVRESKRAPKAAVPLVAKTKVSNAVPQAKTRAAKKSAVAKPTADDSHAKAHALISVGVTSPAQQKELHQHLSALGMPQLRELAAGHGIKGVSKKAIADKLVGALHVKGTEGAAATKSDPFTEQAKQHFSSIDKNGAGAAVNAVHQAYKKMGKAQFQAFGKELGFTLSGTKEQMLKQLTQTAEKMGATATQGAPVGGSKPAAPSTAVQPKSVAVVADRSDVPAGQRRPEFNAALAETLKERTSNHFRSPAPNKADLPKQPIERDVSSALAEYTSKHPYSKPSIGEMFDAVRAKHPNLTQHQFHTALRIMHDEKKLRLAPWTGPLDKAERQEHLVAHNNEAMYHIGAGSTTVEKPVTTSSTVPVTIPESKPEKVPSKLLDPKQAKTATEKLEQLHVDYVAKMPSAERNEVSTYTGADFININGKLRTGAVNDNMEKRCKLLDNAIENAPPLPSSMRVYRGMTLKPDERAAFLKNMQDTIRIGGVFTDKAFVSTSGLPNKPVERFSTDGGVIFQIKPQRGLVVGKASWVPNEGEVLMRRGAKLKPTHMEEAEFTGPDGMKYKRTVVHMEEV